MNRTGITALLAFATLLTAAAPAFGQGQIELEGDRQRKLLRYMDLAKGCPAEGLLRGMDPNIDSILVNLLHDKDTPLRYRLYAVDCLGYFNNKRSQQVLASLLGDPTWDKVYRLRAMGASARAMGVDILEELMEACNDRDAETRAAAVGAIGWINVQRAHSFLQHLKTRERDPEVIQAITESLKRIPADPIRPPDTGI
ncbi:MAG: HEAT repeat domain-containing protein [Pseudomonadota bacterium]